MTNKHRFFQLTTASDELLHLDLMRFIACLGIVAHHSIEFFVPADQRPHLNTQTMGLALFVDLFFVISGYVIAYVYHNRIATKADYFRFLQRRVGRLVPLHWVTLILAITLWSAFALMHYSGNHTPSFNPLCIADAAFLTHAFVPCENNLFFNSVSWSISAEMMMYIAFPLFAFLAAKSARLILATGLLTLAGTVVVAALTQKHEILWVDVSPVLRALPSFIIGSALFYNRSVLARLPASGAILATASTALIAAMLGGLPELAILPIIYLVAIAAIARDTQKERSPAKLVKRLAPLGQLTYSIYMWHGLLILIFMNALGDKLLHGNPIAEPILAIVCYTSIMIVAYLSYLYLETPARRWVDGLALGHHQKKRED